MGGTLSRGGAAGSIGTAAQGGTLITGGRSGGFGGGSGAVGPGRGGTGTGGCGVIADFPDTCAEGGAAGESPDKWCASSGEAGAGAGGDSGGSLGVAGSSPKLLIDDFEDGDLISERALGARGVWYAVNDGTGQQYPSPVCTQIAGSGIAPGHEGNGLRTYGIGFSMWAQVGVSLRGEPTCMGPLDASQATGVRFFVRGKPGQGVVLQVNTTATNPPEDGGTCTAYCYQPFISYARPVDDEWHSYEVPFSELGPSANGVFDPSQILNLVWQAANVSCFDFTIDDVELY